MARVVEKDPDVDSTYTIDWTNQLPSGVTVSSAVWTLPSGVTETTSSNSDTTTSITLGGGTEGTTYELTCTATLSSAATLDTLLYVYVRQQVVSDVRAMPVKLDELKTTLRVTTSDDDENIKTLLAAAVSFVETHTGRTFVDKTSTVYLPRFPYGDRCIEVRQTPVRSIARIRYYDESDVLQTLATTVYSTVTLNDGATIAEVGVDQTWPDTSTRSDAVELLLVSGYGVTADNVPPLAKLAIKQLAWHWYEHPAGTAKTTPAIDAMLAQLSTGYYADVQPRYTGGYYTRR